MIKIFLIKHAEKAYANGRGPKGEPLFDPPLLLKSMSSSSSIIIKDDIDELHVSPYRRTRDTAVSPLLCLNHPKEYIINTDIAEFLGNQKKHHKLVSFHQSTIDALNGGELPPFGESYRDMSKRSRRFIRSLMTQVGKTFCVVSHGVVIKEAIAGALLFAKQKHPSSEIVINGYNRMDEIAPLSVIVLTLKWGGDGDILNSLNVESLSF